MEVPTSPSSSPPQAAERTRLPELPQRRLLFEQTIALPDLTSELSDLSDLSDTTPPVSPSFIRGNQEDNLNDNPDGEAYDGFDNDSDDNVENDTISNLIDDSPPAQHASIEKVATDTHNFWRRKRRNGYKFERFLEGWLLGKTANNRHTGGRMAGMIRVLEKPRIQQRLKEAGIQLRFQNKSEAKWINPSVCRNELLALTSQPAFRTFDPSSFTAPGDMPCAVKDVCNTDWIHGALQSAWPQILATAPTLGAFLTAMLANRRAGQNSYTAGNSDAAFPHEARAYMIVALFLGAYAPKKSNFLPISLGLYLHSNGVQRRVIETLARFGICQGYLGILQRLKNMAEQAKQNPKRVAHDPSAVFVYDSFNFQDRVRDLLS